VSRLEDDWNESTWEVEHLDDLSGVYVVRRITDDFDLCVEHIEGLDYLATATVDDIDGPCVRVGSVDEGKRVAEAMFRQWVYDEYGTVLS
jgi:hypothetical protein